jgi:hypothetical protein
MYDLYADGAQMFLNAVDYMLSSPSTASFATNPSPASGTADVPRDVVLSWTPGIGAISHHIYFGTNQLDVATGVGDTDKGTQTETSYDPGALADGTTYYWRVDEFDGATTHTGNVWSFTTTSPPNLVGWWKLDETSGTIAADSSSEGNHGTVFGNPQWITGQINGALALDGVDDYVDLPIGSVIASLSSCTITTWVNFSNTGGAWQRIWDFGSNETYNMFLTPRTGMDGNLRFAITRMGNSNESQLNAPSTLATGWHHVAVAINGATREMQMYLDSGVVANSTTQVLPRDLGNTTQNWLGRSQYPADAYFNGSLDDLRIYNWALTASEVAVVMSEGLNTANNPSPPDRAALVPTDAVLSWNPGQYADKHDVYFGTVFEDVDQARRWNDPHGVLVSQNQMANTYDPPGLLEYATTYYWRIDEVSAPLDSTIYMGNIWSFTTTLPPSLIGWWKLDDGSGNVVQDWSGYGNHGTINNPNGGLGAGGSVWYSDPQYGTVASFSGDDSSGAYISAGSIPAMTLTNGFTWTFWAKQDIEQGTELPGGGNDVIVGNRSGGTQDPLQFIKFTPTKFEFYHGTQYGINYADIPGGVWIHHAVVKDGQSLTYYRNGVFSGTRTIAVTVDPNPFFIGGDPYPLGERWRGLIRDVRIYNYALTPSAIADLVNEGSNTDSDGVTNAVEAGAPNGGDGNSDHIPDSQQDNVTSLPNAVDQQYVTIVSPAETALENVSATANPPEDAPTGVEFPVGFFEFTVSGLTAGGSTTVTLLLPAGHTFGTYYKYGPEPGPGNETPHWYEFLWDGTPTGTGAEILPDRIILRFVDGLRGDSDLTVNGQIHDPGAPAIDITPPTIHSVSANPNVLWPVNHKMVAVTVTVACEDNVDPAPVCKIVNVTCNEPVNGPGDGNTDPDWKITGDLTVNLRAERAGGGSGRVYTIHVNCVDASGNTATATVDVTVPHDQGKGKK